MTIKFIDLVETPARYYFGCLGFIFVGVALALGFTLAGFDLPVYVGILCIVITLAGFCLFLFGSNKARKERIRAENDSARAARPVRRRRIRRPI